MPLRVALETGLQAENGVVSRTGVPCRNMGTSS